MTTLRPSDALVVVDMQVDFVVPGRPGAVAGALDCVAPIQRTAEAVRDAGGPVAWVRREYLADGADVETSRIEKWRLAPFCVAGSEGVDLVDGLAPADGDIELVKRRWSAFFGTSLADDLRRRDTRRVIVAGVDLSRCIRATVMDAISHDFQVAVLVDGTSTRSAAAKTANLADLEDIGVELVG